MPILARIELQIRARALQQLNDELDAATILLDGSAETGKVFTNAVDMIGPQSGKASVEKADG